MAKRLTSKKRITKTNLENIPNQSGVYVMYRKSGSCYVGSAKAGRLQDRIKERVKTKRNLTSFQYRPTSSTKKARKLEAKYRDRLNADQEI